MGNNIILSVENISKSFEGKVVFESVSFKIKKGDISCLKGPNGAGKSVLIDCILAFQPMDNGKITLLGRNINNRLHTRRHTGIVSIDHQSHFDLLTPTEIFELTIDLFSLNRKYCRKIYTDLISSLQVETYMNEPFKQLSFGSKKKIQLIASLLPEPDLLVCDEIFEGLDGESIEEVKKIFVKRAESKKATFITTHHNVEEMNILTSQYILENHTISIIGD